MDHDTKEDTLQFNIVELINSYLRKKRARASSANAKHEIKSIKEKLSEYNAENTSSKISIYLSPPKGISGSEDYERNYINNLVLKKHKADSIDVIFVNSDNKDLMLKNHQAILKHITPIYTKSPTKIGAIMRESDILLAPGSPSTYKRDSAFLKNISLKNGVSVIQVGTQNRQLIHDGKYIR